MTILPITLTIAGAATLLNLWLAIRIGRVRFKRKLPLGDGGDPVLLARMRAQANFIENTPFVLILLGLVEFATGPQTWLWVAALIYILARVAHAFGMDRPSPNPLRMGGAIFSMLVTVALAGYALWIPYTAKPAGSHVTIVG